MFVTFFIRIYQSFLGVKKLILVSAFGYVSHCKHSPSCSEYTRRAVKKHGTIRGLWLGFKKIITCY